MSTLTSAMTVDLFEDTSYTVPIMTLGNGEQSSNISFHMLNENEPILKIDKTGFYVRGQRVQQDEQEAEKVYNAFHQWLTWTTLTRKY